MEWTKVLFNGLETNVKVTRCGKIRKVKVDWMIYEIKLGEINFDNLKLDSSGYKRVGIKVKDCGTKSKRLHQLMAAAFLGYQFNGNKLVVDHIDSNKLNNHIDNLRIVTQRENVTKETTAKSGLPTGVCRRKNSKKYQSHIIIDKKCVYLGLFETIEEASNAYQTKLKSLSIR
jgi:hypothetical protein